MIRFAIPLAVLVCAAHAVELNLNIASPVIDTIKARMEKRAPKILGFLKQGVAGETNHGLIEVLDVKSLDLAAQKIVLDTLAAENDDRQAFFRELALAYGLKSADEAGQTYAESRYTLADPSFWIQDKNGAWIKKKDFAAKK